MVPVFRREGGPSAGRAPGLSGEQKDAQCGCSEMTESRRTEGAVGQSTPGPTDKSRALNFTFTCDERPLRFLQRSGSLTLKVDAL